MKLFLTLQSVGNAAYVPCDLWRLPTNATADAPVAMNRHLSTSIAEFRSLIITPLLPTCTCDMYDGKARFHLADRPC